MTDCGQRYGNFSSGVWEAVQNGIDEFEFELNVCFKDPLGETECKSAFRPARWIDLDDEEIKKIKSGEVVMDFETAYSRGGFAPRRKG